MRLSLNQPNALNHSNTVELPVLEDAGSIQMALMQVMRLILARQLDHKTGGLLLYGLQTASANLRHLDLAPRDKTEVVIDLSSVSEVGVGDDHWGPEDFEDEDDEDDSEDGEEEEEAESGSATAVAQTDARPAVPESLPEPGQPEAAQRRKNPAQGASPGFGDESEQAPQARKKPLKASAEIDEEKELQRVQAALQGAERGNWRDLKTVFEFAGIYPPKDDGASGTG